MKYSVCTENYPNFEQPIKKSGYNGYMENIFNRNFFLPDSFQQIVVGGISMGLAFQISFPDSRGTHLSCVENFCVYLNKKRIDDYKIRFCLRGKEFLVPALPQLGEEYWNLQEYAGIKLYLDKKISGTHKVTVEFKYRVPFTGTRAGCIREMVRGTHIFTL